MRHPTSRCLWCLRRSADDLGQAPRFLGRSPHFDPICRSPATDKEVELAYDENRWSAVTDKAADEKAENPVDLHLRRLVDQSVQGSFAARNELFGTLLPKMVAVTRSALSPGSTADVEDVVQEALIRLNRALPNYRGESSVGYFATRVAVHTATDFLRRKMARRKYEDEAARSRDDAHVDAEPWDAQSRSRLRFLLEDLSDVQAETLVHVALGHSVQEIASGMGVPVETVRSRLRLARKTVRERIAADPQLKELFGRGE